MSEEELDKLAQENYNVMIAVISSPMDEQDAYITGFKTGYNELDEKISELQSTCKSQKKALDIYANITMPAVEKTISDLKAENERMQLALEAIMRFCNPEEETHRDFYLCAKEALQSSTTDKK